MNLTNEEWNKLYDELSKTYINLIKWLYDNEGSLDFEFNRGFKQGYNKAVEKVKKILLNADYGSYIQGDVAWFDIEMFVKKEIMKKLKLKEKQ